MPVAAPGLADKAPELSPWQVALPSSAPLGEHPSTCHLPAGSRGDGSTVKNISLGMKGWGVWGCPTYIMSRVMWL